MSPAPAPFIPALRFHALTRVYDPIVNVLIGRDKLRAGFIRVVGAPESSSLLDVGCGTGTLLAEFARLRPDLRLAGVDLDGRALEIARKKVAATASVDLRRASATELPFADNVFDRVVTSLLLHHLNDQQKQLAMREIKRVLKPDGELHVCDWGRPHSLLMRGAFLSVRALDGFEPTRANANGDLPRMLVSEGFSRVQLHAQFATPFGTLAYIRARKVAAES